MKGLKKIALVSAIAAASAGAQAELKALDDSAMGELTGQAGLTIDLETKYTIGEFMYKDAGSVFLKGISLGANENGSSVPNADGFVDNIRIKLDIAGAGEELDHGFSRVADLAAVQHAASNLGNLGGSPGATSTADVELFRQAKDGEAMDLSVFKTAAGLSDNSFAVLTLDASGNQTYNTQNSVDASGNEILDVDGNNIAAVDASGNTVYTEQRASTTTVGTKKTYGDGDLVIHVSFKDAWQKAGGLTGLLASGGLSTLSFDEVLTSGLKSVDFNFSIDAIGLASSDFEAGDSLNDNGLDSHISTGLDADDSTTVLISDLSINGFLGPVDIHIENNGNGFSQDTSLGAIAGIGKADSVINWDTYVNITDMELYIDIAGVLIDDMKINNVRGDVTDLDGNFAFGFAQSKRDIYAVRNAAGYDSAELTANMNTIIGGALSTGAAAAFAAIQGGAGTGADIVLARTALKGVADTYAVDGIAINTEFKGDMEIGHLSFGDTGESIGELYWTDIESTTNWTISAH